MKISYIVYLTDRNIDKINNIIEKIKNISSWIDAEIILIDDRRADSVKDKKIQYDHQYDDIVKVVNPEVESLKKYEAYNLGIDNSTGDYIRFIEFGDNIISDAFNEGLLYSMQGFDVIELYGADKGNTINNITFNDILSGDINFDRCIFNASIKKKLGYFFEGYYIDVEKPKFLINCYLSGCSFVKIPYDNIVETIDEYSIDQLEGLANIYQRKNSPENEMTFIIAFRNENHEIERTVSSMRYMCSHSNITLVNDCSTDNFDYEAIAKRYGCTYKYLNTNQGSAGAKHYGGITNDTTYFCFFDGHQRIYHKDLDLIFVRYLEDYPKSIFATRSVYIDKKKGYYINESDYKGKPNHKGLSYCCYITDIKGREWDPKWCDRIIDEHDPDKTRVMCVLGAVYAMRTDWFRFIHGMDGLTIYGLEESFISIKTWMLGGECYVLKNIGVGHLYRSINASPVDPNCIDANRMFLSYVFLDDEHKIKEYNANLKKYIGNERYSKAWEYVDKKLSFAKFTHNWLYNTKVKDLDTVFKEINDKVKK